MTRPPRSAARFGSLVVKLTLVAALMMLAFGWLRTTLTSWAFETFAIPAPTVSPEDEARIDQQAHHGPDHRAPHEALALRRSAHPSAGAPLRSSSASSARRPRPRTITVSTTMPTARPAHGSQARCPSRNRAEGR